MKTYVYSWGPRGNMAGAMSRKGQRCRILARGSMNSALVEFEDGYWAVVSRNALRVVRRCGCGILIAPWRWSTPTHTTTS